MERDYSSCSASNQVLFGGPSLQSSDPTPDQLQALWAPPLPAGGHRNENRVQQMASPFVPLGTGCRAAHTSRCHPKEEAQQAAGSPQHAGSYFLSEPSITRRAREKKINITLRLHSEPGWKKSEQNSALAEGWIYFSPLNDMEKVILCAKCKSDSTFFSQTYDMMLLKQQPNYRGTSDKERLL